LWICGKITIVLVFPKKGVLWNRNLTHVDRFRWFRYLGGRECAEAAEILALASGGVYANREGKLRVEDLRFEWTDVSARAPDPEGGTR
jgi:hypothetical protein